MTTRTLVTATLLAASAAFAALLPATALADNGWKIRARVTDQHHDRYRDHDRSRRHDRWRQHDRWRHHDRSRHHDRHRDRSWNRFRHDDRFRHHARRWFQHRRHRGHNVWWWRDRDHRRIGWSRFNRGQTRHAHYHGTTLCFVIH